jgi:hypothetical protein
VVGNQHPAVSRQREQEESHAKPPRREGIRGWAASGQSLRSSRLRVRIGVRSTPHAGRGCIQPPPGIAYRPPIAWWVDHFAAGRRVGHESMNRRDRRPREEVDGTWSLDLEAVKTNVSYVSVRRTAGMPVCMLASLSLLTSSGCTCAFYAYRTGESGVLPAGARPEYVAVASVAPATIEVYWKDPASFHPPKPLAPQRNHTVIGRAYGIAGLFWQGLEGAVIESNARRAAAAIGGNAVLDLARGMPFGPGNEFGGTIVRWSDADTGDGTKARIDQQSP